MYQEEAVVSMVVVVGGQEANKASQPQANLRQRASLYGASCMQFGSMSSLPARCPQPLAAIEASAALFHRHVQGIEALSECGGENQREARLEFSGPTLTVQLLRH